MGVEVPAAPAATDPNTPPPADPNTPPAADPQTVPLAALTGERRVWHGQRQSLTATIEELRSENAKLKGSQTPKTPTDEEQWRTQAIERLGIKGKLDLIDQLVEDNKKLREAADNGQRAHSMIVKQQERAMDKATKIGDESFDNDLKSIGFTKESWDNLLASEIQEDEIGELFANPSHMREIVKRCKARYQPTINQRKSQTATTVANLPRTPGPGGTPPAPPANEPLKVGKGLHSRAFDRLQGLVRSE